MASSRELISAVTVGSGGASSINFTSIPQTYAHLAIKLSGRSSRSAAGEEEFYLTFNGSTSNYSEKWLRGTGSTVSAASFSGSSFQQVGQPAAAATASVFGNWEFYIPNYTNANYKSVSMDGVTESNATRALTYLDAGLWSDTSAITSVTISAGSYLAVEYSTAYLYGIKNS